MRAFMTALVGVATASIYLVLGVMLDGLLGAAIVIVSLAGIALALGIAIAVATTPLHLRQPRLRRTKTGRTTHRGHAYACSHCGAHRELRGHIWVCVDCDLKGEHLLLELI